MITIKGRLEYSAAITIEEVDKNLEQISNDALVGTYADFPGYWNDKFIIPTNEFSKYQFTKDDDGHFSFSLEINDNYFKIYPAGFQHLVGVLAGDLFPTKNLNVRVKEVVLSDKMKAEATALFRDNKAHSIDETRKAFSLREGEQLLAFTFKPRNGLRPEILEEVTLGVLKAGFHIVELDTRNLTLDASQIDFLVELSTKAANLNKRHVTRFSPNLSLPSHMVVDITERFIAAQPDPIVIKIDGGLDGISALQAIRSFYSKDIVNQRSPIITCYPLLRHQLSERISAEFFLQALSLSGADIIYIGSRPYLPSEARDLDAVNADELKSSVVKYREYIKMNQSMPTLAGGVPLAQLHAFYDLLGPKAGLFLGGAVALHKDGPIKGAALCAKVLYKAIEIREKLGKGKYKQFDKKLILEIEESYDSKYAYYSPSELQSTYKAIHLFE